MRRRAFVASLAAGSAGVVTGCVGGGSEVVTVVQRSITIPPGDGWVKEVPDVSDPGGAVQYTAQSSDPFHVYFFTSEQAYMYYHTYVSGDEPALTPGGHDEISTAATETGDNSYGAATGESGSRVSVSESGPYFFVLDHSDYRDETVPADDADRVSVFLNLTVTERRFGL